MNLSDLKRNSYMLRGSLAKRGYVRWWHSFTGVNPISQETRTFFVEYFMIPSYVMIKAGVFPNEYGEDGRQLHAFYPLGALRVASSPLYVQIDDCVFSENHISGYVDVTKQEAANPYFMTDAGCMEWDLEVHKAISCHTGAIGSRFFTALNALDSFWHGEGIRTCFRGNVTLDGITYEITPETCHGYADKHWGRKFNSPWLQLASNCLISERTGKHLKHSALAIDGCCPRFLCFPLRHRLMIQLTYTGEDFEYNFARPSLFSRCKWKMKETNKRYIWKIWAQNRNSLLKISYSCQKELMMPLSYESPDGARRKKPLLGSSAGQGILELYRRTPGGLELIDRLEIANGFCEYQKSE